MYINYEQAIIDFYESLKRQFYLEQEAGLVTVLCITQIRIDTVEKLMDELEINYEKRKISTDSGKF